MARPQRLKLTLRDRVGHREWTHQAITVTADPDETATLVSHLKAMARDLDNRDSGDWWAGQYAIRVQGLDEAWRDFEITGGGA